MTGDSQQDWLRRFTNSNADLAVLADEFVQSWDEMLPFVFMADVGRWLSQTDEASRRAVLAELDQAWSTEGEDVRGLIEVGLLESLEADSIAWRQLGPHIVNQSDEYRRWKTRP